MDSEFLFDKHLIEYIDPMKMKSRCRSDFSLPYINPNLIIRPLSLNDYHIGFLDILSELTSVGDISEQSFTNRFKAMKNCPDTYYVIVIEDLNKHCIIGTGTLVIEQKFIHECSTRARIEDIVISNDYRGQQLGKILVMVLSSLAEKLRCYKVTLECKDQMVPFYKSIDFFKESGNSNYMQIRFDLKK